MARDLALQPRSRGARLCVHRPPDTYESTHRQPHAQRYVLRLRTCVEALERDSEAAAARLVLRELRRKQAQKIAVWSQTCPGSMVPFRNLMLSHNTAFPRDKLVGMHFASLVRPGGPLVRSWLGRRAPPQPVRPLQSALLRPTGCCSVNAGVPAECASLWCLTLRHSWCWHVCPLARPMAARLRGPVCLQASVQPSRQVAEGLALAAQQFWTARHCYEVQHSSCRAQLQQVTP